MSTDYLKAVEYSKLSADIRKAFGSLRNLIESDPHRWQCQPKFDGCYGRAEIREVRSECRMYSRTGEDYTASTQFILDSLWLQSREHGGMIYPFNVLGEVWRQGVDFPEISGMFRRNAASNLQFMAHDLLPWARVTNRPYHKRLRDLADLLGSWRLNNVQVVPTSAAPHRGIHDMAAALHALGGYDGAIVRDMSAGYTWGLAKRGEIIKVKPILSLDLLIHEVHAATGIKTGRNVYTIDVIYKGVTTRVGSGVPHNRSEFDVGQIAEIECIGITATGRLREPRFRAIRHDKETQDV